MMNSFGLLNTAFGGKIGFDTSNLTLYYYGGFMDKIQDPSKWSLGFTLHVVTGNSNLKEVYSHELHHFWHSRALNDLFLLNYGLQGLNALLLKGNFVDERNYYEDFVNYYPWWNTDPVWK